MNKSSTTPWSSPDLTALTAVLAEVTQGLASSLDIDDTLQQVVDQMMRYLEAEAASLFLLDEEAANLVCRKCAGPVDVVGLSLRADEGIVGLTAATNRPQIVSDVTGNPSFAAAVDADTGFVTHSILCVPLMIKGTTIGALELINKHAGDGRFAADDANLAMTVAASAALAIHNARMAQALVEQERVRRELQLAREIQLSLLPRSGAGELPVVGWNIPAHGVSGDFFDYFVRADGHVYFSIADVSGKGMNAALLMAKTTSVLRCLAKTEIHPGHLLSRVNRELCDTASHGMFVTVVVGFIDTQARRVRMANAGHQPPLRREATGNYDEIAAAAPPLGIDPSFTFPVQEISLASGSVMYMFTDGVSEATNSDGVALGGAGVRSLIDASQAVAREDRLRHIVALIEAQGYTLKDDITLLHIDLD